ncbi:unnamed protein product [Sympodiomycopsis kandeliae]
MGNPSFSLLTMAKRSGRKKDCKGKQKISQGASSSDSEKITHKAAAVARFSSGGESCDIYVELKNAISYIIDTKGLQTTSMGKIRYGKDEPGLVQDDVYTRT